MPLWFNDVAVLVAFLATSEIAFRAGRKRRARTDATTKHELSAAQASTLGLLALILGFTLSMAESRFDARRKIVLEEALAVGTTYLRADLLPDPERTQSRRLLRDYIQTRRDYFQASPAEASAATHRSELLQTELWSRVAALAPTHNTPLMATYVASLNEMIDLETARDVSLAARIPWTINLLLVLVALGGIAVNAYAIGLSGRRVLFGLTLVPILIALACIVIFDLDRSRAGFITTGDLPMEKLQRTISESPTARAE